MHLRSIDHLILPGLCSLSFCLLFNHKAFGQIDTTDHSLNNQFWFDYDLTYELNDRWDIYGDIGFRTIVPHNWNRYLIRPAVRFDVPKLIFKQLKYREELHGGIGFFYTTNLNISNRLEIRPFQGYRLIWPNTERIRLRQYVRLEERFDLNTRNWENTFGLRVRYLAELTIKLQGDVIDEINGAYIKVSMELFWNLLGTKQFNDHLRASAGLGYGFTQKWKGEFHLAYHYARDTVLEAFDSSDIVYRFRAFYRLN